MSLRAAPKEAYISVAELVYCSPLTLHGEFAGTPELFQHEVVQKVTRDETGFILLPKRSVPAQPASKGQPSILQEANHVYIYNLRGQVPGATPRVIDASQSLQGGS